MLEGEVYSKDGWGRKDQYSSRSREWVEEKKVGVRRGGARATVEAPGKGKLGAGSLGRRRGQPPCHPPALRSAAVNPQSLSLRPPRPSSVLLKLGHLKIPFFPFQYSGLGHLVKKKPGPHAQCPAQTKTNGPVQAAPLLKSYLQKEKCP